MNRIPTTLIAILVALLWSAPVQAASCKGNSHQITLSNGAATPGSGGTTTQITFSVRYSDTGGCQPSAITVSVIGAGTFPLTGSGTGYAAGVVYRRTITLPAGSHGYSFSATSGEGGGTKTATLTAVRPTGVLITAPTPPPTPKPQTPKPATPAPPVVVPPAAPVVPPPPPTPTVAPTASPSPVPESPSSAPTASGADAVPNLHDFRAKPAAPVVPTRADPATAPAPWSIPDYLTSYLVTTAAGLMLFAFLMRRQLRPLRVAFGRAAMPSVTEMASRPAERVTPPPPLRQLIPPLNPNLLHDDEEGLGPDPSEAGTPRWLRPSVRNARGGLRELRQRDW